MRSQMRSMALLTDFVRFTYLSCVALLSLEDDNAHLRKQACIWNERKYSTTTQNMSKRNTHGLLRGILHIGISSKEKNYRLATRNPSLS